MRVLAFLVLVTALWVPGASAWEQGQFTWSAPWSWMSLVPESKLGLCIASGKDLNGDSIHDMVFAAPFEDHNGEELGRVYVVLGSTSGWVPEQGILSSAVASYWGEAGGDHPGGADEGGSAGLALVQSLNNDALADIVVVSPGNDEAGYEYGKVYILFGKTSGWAHGVSLAMADASFTGEGFMGRASVAAVGDVNGDGKGDFVVGAPMIGSGKVYLILGKSSWSNEPASLAGADASFVGEMDPTGMSRAGFSVAGVPDLNGDGRDEILIGAPKYSSANGFFCGKAYLILGRASGWTHNESLANADYSIVGQTDGAEVGHCVAGVGDVDDDGKGDFVLASRLGEGHLFLLLGGSLSFPASNVPVSNANTTIVCAHLSTGDAMAPLGDVNNDGFDDFAVGAPVFDAGAGKAYAVFGRGSWPSTLDIEDSEGQWRGLDGKFWAGCSVAGGDLNGDGRADILIGAAADPFGGYDAGSVFAVPSNYGGDVVPPARTTDLSATYNLAGIATLSWSPVTLDANGQPENVLFYRVLRYRHDFDNPLDVNRSPLPAVIHPSTGVSDTLSVLGDPSNFYYYRLFSVDRSGNVSTLSTGTGEFDVVLDIP